MKRITISLLFALALTSLGAVAASSQAKEITGKEYMADTEAAQKRTWATVPRRVHFVQRSGKGVRDYAAPDRYRTYYYSTSEPDAIEKEEIVIGKSTFIRMAGGKWFCPPIVKVDKNKVVTLTGSSFVPTNFVQTKIIDGETYVEYRKHLERSKYDEPDQTPPPSDEWYLIDSKGRVYRAAGLNQDSIEVEYDVKIDPIVAPKGLKCKK